MKHIVLTICALLLGGLLFAQNVEGVWETFDTKRQKPMSHVRIYKQDGKLYGVVIKVLDEEKKTDSRFDGDSWLGEKGRQVGAGRWTSRPNQRLDYRWRIVDGFS